MEEKKKILSEAYEKNHNTDDVKKRTLLQRIHDFYGHPGITSMFHIIKDFKNVRISRREISSAVQSCKECLRSKNTNFFKKKDFQKILSPGPFKTLSSDILGPVECNVDGITQKGYILTITDVFSRYTALFFKNNITGKTIVNMMGKIIRKFGKPEKILTDNGPQYISRIFSDWCAKNNINHIKAPIYSSFSNGISERVNSKIKTHLIIYGKTKRISEILKISERGLNFCYNRQLKTTPIQLLYRIQSNQKLTKDPEKIFSDSLERKISKFAVGDIVYCRNYLRKSLEDRFTGPYTISELSKRGNWCKLNKDLEWHHVKNLKPVGGGSVVSQPHYTL